MFNEKHLRWTLGDRPNVQMSHTLSSHKQSTLSSVLHIKLSPCGTNVPVIFKCVPVLIRCIACSNDGNLYPVPIGFVWCASSLIHCKHVWSFDLKSIMIMFSVFVTHHPSSHCIYFIPHSCDIIVGK